MRDPLAGSPWSRDSTVEGFVRSPANETLLRFAAAERRPSRMGWLLDIGCGAGRNAVPLANAGWNVLGTDLSWPMLAAARRRAGVETRERPLRLALAPMHTVPAKDQAFDLIVAHGIWNLAASVVEFRRAVAEAARVAAPGAGLFVFTFSRHTLPDDACPVPGEPYAYTQFSGHPQTFLTRDQLVDELSSAGFELDHTIPLTEHNRPPAGTVHAIRGPVILEATFRRVGPPRGALPAPSTRP